MEGRCSFKCNVGGVCGYSNRDRKRKTEIIPLLSCTKNIANHKSAFKFTGPENEIDLILCRAAMFNVSEQQLRTLTVCPNHREKLDLGWTRGSSTRCRVPERISLHGKGKGVWPKGERGLGKNESEVILLKTGSFVQVGSGKFYIFYYVGQVINVTLIAFLRYSGVCRDCREILKEMMNIEVKDPEMGVDSNISDQMKKMTLVSKNRNASSDSLN